jgi:predicted permease
MVQSFLNIYHADLGIQPEHLLTMRIELPAPKYPRPDDQISFHQLLKQRLESIPGVDSEAIAQFLPTGGSQSYPYELEGAPTDDKRRPTLSAVVISPGYFKTLNLTALRGRVFDDTDGLPGRLNVLVNERFASKSWPGRDPIDERIRLFDAGEAGPWLAVVGMVPNIIQNDISPKEIDPLIYLPYRFKPAADMAIIARTRVPPGSLGTAFRRELQAADPDLPLYNLWTMDERLLRNYWFQRLIGVLFAIFAGIALVLAAFGLNALIANSVIQRTQEIGIRMATGASAQDIVRMVLLQAMRQLAIGLMIGLAGAFAATKALKSILVQISPGDPRVLLLASIVLIVAAVLGCLVPARRAAQVDPLVALRHE